MTSVRSTRCLRAAALLPVVLLLASCSSDDTDGTDGTAALAAASASGAAGADGADGGRATAALEDVFAVRSPWNVPVGDAPVAARSDALLATTWAGTGALTVNTREWTVPVVAGGVPTVLSCRQATCGDGSGEVTLDVPADVDPDPRYDGWFTVVDPDAGQAHDLWRARREGDGSISYLFMRTWDLDGPGFSQPYVDGARGSGLPLAGGLIRPAELEHCQVNHALALSLPAPAADYFVQPASATDGTSTSPDALPEGARVRLRADARLEPPVDPATGRPLPFTPERRRYAGCLVEALRTYGAVVVGRAASPTLYFQRLAVGKGRHPHLNGYELSSLGPDDFTVVDFADLTRYPVATDGATGGAAG